MADDRAKSTDGNGGGLPAELRERLKLQLSEGDAQQHVWELTMKLVTSQEARRQAENRLARALDQVEQLRLRRPASGDAGVADAVLRRKFETVSANLRETQQALVQARDRVDELEGRLQRELDNRGSAESELARARQQFDEAAKLLKEIEEAYVEGQKRTNGGR